MYRPSRVVGQWSCPGQRAAAMWKHCSLPEVRLTSEGPYGGAGGGCISISDPVSVTQRPHRNSENDRSRRFGLGFGVWARDWSRNLSFSELYACQWDGIARIFKRISDRKKSKIFWAAKIFVRNRASFRQNQRGRTTPGLGGPFAGPCELCRTLA